VPLTILQATDDRLEGARTLFREYQASLGIDLDFQGFESELVSLPAPYQEPEGTLLLAYWNGDLAGCAGIKPIGNERCELKRLYVRPMFRGKSVARRLCERLILEAETRRYRWMLLDTLARLSSAVALYRDLGFVEIPAYYDNPLPEPILYMERALA